MKIVHTADWHIGQQFYGYERTKEHSIFFEWLISVVQDYSADALIIAGDIFDGPNPSAQSQRLYYSFLRDITLRNPSLQVVIIAGNHDSASRLEAPNALLQHMNIFVKGVVSRDLNGNIDLDSMFVPLKRGESIVAWCVAVPYLRQGDYYSDGIASLYSALYDRLYQIKEKNTPIIFTGHLQATGSEISNDDRFERSIIGGLESISPEIFLKPDVVYTALGHLHRAQRVSHNDNIRYSGSPLPFSFAEKNYKQGVNIVELDIDSPINSQNYVKIDRVEFDAPVKLISIPDSPRPLAEVLELISQLPKGEVCELSPFLELKILLNQPEPSMRHQLEEALKDRAVRLASAQPFKNISQSQEKSIISTYQQLKSISPVDMAKDIFSKNYGLEMPSELLVLLKEVVEEVES